MPRSSLPIRSHRLSKSSLLVFCLSAIFLAGAGLLESSPAQDELRQVDEYTIVGPKSFLDGYTALRGGSNINVVVEIPAGTNAKWEVRKEDGALVWEFKDGEPRVVQYLPYPANYGMIPRTLLAKDEGGDGDPLDVILLGAAVPRGSVISAWPVGILRLMDGGEVDDKILAVMPGGPIEWHKAIALEEVRKNYPGVLEIVEIWFSSYKGPGEMESKGYADAKAAWDMIHEARETHEEVRGGSADKE